MSPDSRISRRAQSDSLTTDLHIPVMGARDRRGSHAQGAFHVRRIRRSPRPARRSAGEAASQSAGRPSICARHPRGPGAWPVLHGLFDPIGHLGGRRRTDDDFAVHSARRRLADCARLRIRQRLSRHRERGRHRHLHPCPAGAGCCRVVGVLEPPRRFGFDRRGGLRHRLAAAGRAHSSGRLRCGLRNGVCAAHFRDHLEPGHLVARHSRFEFAHPDRVDRRRRRRQRAHPRPERHRRRGLGSGHQGRRSAAILAAVRLRPLGVAAARNEGRHPGAGALHRPDHQQAAIALDPRTAHSHLHAGVVLPRLQRWPEGHGPYHADPDRRRADGLRAEPRAPGRPRRPVRHRGARRFEDRRSPWRRIRHHRRSSSGGDAIRPLSHDHAREPIRRSRS